ncbi:MULTISPECIES: hypothetical protein [Methylobacterium]|uniref:Uncharacterized protein n=1 Tax=Methylobacterium longum TaxID=767694 RepID=A0ABT8ANZ6_9HYPH|nr:MULTISPECIES: hypothetical protein [Methylobacterium]MCJ2103439.1 hypothetical protein [Methylobacterium sp. E-046]MDN3571201.1 hypothetical protein [Methylobacterium longum]GJE09047.1 hypothetical protein FOHLNKBM_0066 [Methylobacterium longum]
MSGEGIDPDKAAAIRLRARLAVVERAAWFGLVHAMKTRPAETEAYIASERARCTEGFGGGTWAKDLSDAERRMLAEEVDAGLAQLIEDARGEI